MPVINFLVPAKMTLIPWHFPTHYGFTLRGYHSEPSGKPVLHVLHGNGFCSFMYQPMLEQLSKGYDLFLSDAQGHGDSDHGGPFLGWDTAAELAAEAFSAHQHIFAGQPVFGLGHSFGGVLTALINSQSPSPFQAIILLDPVLFTPAMLTVMRSLDSVRLYHKNPMAKAALRRRRHWPDKDAAFNYLNNRGMFKNWHPDALAAYIEHALRPSEHGLSLKCHPEREAEIFGSYSKTLWQRLVKPSPAVHILYGNSSYPFIAKAITKWCKLNPAVQSRTVPGGHCFMQEQPSTTARAISEILTSSL